MKKIFIISAICLVMCFVVYYLLPIGKSKIYNMGSQIEHSFFYAKTDRYYVEYTGGQREIDFETDGISHRKVNYGLLKVYFYEQTTFADDIEVNVCMSDETKLFILEKNPFENNFICDLCEIACEIKIKVNNVDDDYIDLENISKKWKTNYKQVINKCVKFLDKDIKQNAKNNNNCEYFLTIIHGDDGGGDSYFWNFIIYYQNFKRKNIVLNVNNLDFLVVK